MTKWVHRRIAIMMVGNTTTHDDLADVMVVPSGRCQGGQPDLATNQPVASSSGRPQSQVWDRRRPRRFAELSFLLVGAVVLVAALFTTRSDPDTGREAVPTHRPSAGYTVGPADGTRPRLIVPHTASAGEQVPVLAYRYRGPCGPISLMFDDAPVVHRLTRYAGSPGSGWTEIFMTLDVPRSATPGLHDIALFGPPPVGVDDSGCGDGAHRRQRLATTPITLGP